MQFQYPGCRKTVSAIVLFRRHCGGRDQSQIVETIDILRLVMDLHFPRLIDRVTPLIVYALLAAVPHADRHCGGQLPRLHEYQTPPLIRVERPSSAELLAKEVTLIVRTLLHHVAYNLPPAQEKRVLN